MEAVHNQRGSPKAQMTERVGAEMKARSLCSPTPLPLLQPQQPTRLRSWALPQGLCTCS